MFDRRPAPSWVSGYLYFAGDIYSPACDALVLGPVAAMVRKLAQAGLVRDYFFVRYRDPRPHLRVRLSCHRDASPTVVAEFEARVADLRARGAGMSGSKEDPDEYRLKWMPYVGELERYGGARGLAIAERFFRLSSDLAFDLLAEARAGGQPARLGKAVLAMLVLVHTLVPDRATASDFLLRYGTGYLRAWATGVARQRMPEIFGESYRRQRAALVPYVEAAWRQLEARDRLSPGLDAYRSGVEAVRLELAVALESGALVWNRETLTDWPAVVTHLAPSYLHMSNNRLGVSPVDETFLAHLLSQALRAEGEILTG